MRTQCRVQLFNGAEEIGALQSTSERGSDRVFVAFDELLGAKISAYFNDSTGCPEIAIDRHIIRFEGIDTSELVDLYRGIGELLDQIYASSDEDLPDDPPGFFTDVDDYDYAADDRAFDAARERSLR